MQYALAVICTIGAIRAAMLGRFVYRSGRPLLGVAWCTFALSTVLLTGFVLFSE
jgi:hypothetical protein